MEIPVELTKIIINEQIDQQLIVLRQVNGQRQFPIVIGIHEIISIDRRIKGVMLPRPMTHDLMENMLREMGATVQKIVINDIEKHTFFAKLYININGETVVIDSRPSDALALSAGQNIPIFADDRIFDKLQ